MPSFISISASTAIFAGTALITSCCSLRILTRNTVDPKRIPRYPHQILRRTDSVIDVLSALGGRFGEALVHFFQILLQPLLECSFEICELDTHSHAGVAGANDACAL